MSGTDLIAGETEIKKTGFPVKIKFLSAMIYKLILQIFIDFQLHMR